MCIVQSMNEDKLTTVEPILPLTPQEEEKLKQAFLSGANRAEAEYETGIDTKRIAHWYATGGKEKEQEWSLLSTWKAKKIFHDPQNHKEAEAVLKRHPNTKEQYSERMEHTGKDGKDLIPVLVKFVDGGETKNN